MTTQTNTNPQIERFIVRAANPLTGQLTAAVPSDRDYLATYVNTFGEELLFVQRHGCETAELFHSDFSQEPLKVSKGRVVAIIMNSDEIEFLDECWAKSEAVRLG